MQGSPGREPMRTRIYVDGYNFYYGCLKGSQVLGLGIVPGSLPYGTAKGAR